MPAFLRMLSLGLVTVVMGVSGEAQGQSQPQTIIDGTVFSVTYVEVMPASAADGVALLKRYREATRQETGNVRCEVAQRIGQANQFVILAVWKDQKGFEGHAQSVTLKDMREKIAAIRNAPTDERVHTGLSIGPSDPRAARGAVYVVTHVDVIPPRKDEGVAALKQLGNDSRSAGGNLRFEVVQQINRPNHFTVVEVWETAKAVEEHSMAATTRQFRDKLAPLTGSLYDERMYIAVD